METTKLLRVEAGGRGYGGGSSHGFAGHHEQKRRKLQALFDAIDRADLAEASHVYLALLNFEPGLKDDFQFRALGDALQQGHLYAAQHFMKELHARMDHGVLHPDHVSPAPPPAHPAVPADPEHGLLINVQA